jgi:cytochrome P450
VIPIAFDPFGAAHRVDPYPAYAELRRCAPVSRVERTGAHAIARYEDVAFVLRHPELFSSVAMQTSLINRLPAAGGAPGGAVSAADAARIGELLQRMPVPIGAVMASRSLIAADPPFHGKMRGLVNRGFTPRRIADLEPRVREIARASLGAIGERREFDLVREFTVPLPVTVIAELLGVEPERTADFKRWSDAVIAASTGDSAVLRPVAILEAFAELSEYVIGVIEARRAEPRDDLISTLTRAENGEAALAPVDVVMFALLLLVAGNETTTNLLGNTLLALRAHPEQLERVRRDPALVPALVEEGLRYCGPIQLLYRQATRDVELGGVTIPAGSLVMPLLASANRDESVFEDADRFDVSRSAQGHLAFGLGIHFCLGASLARLEARVALEELLARYARFEPLEPRVEYVDSFLVRGPTRLPLRALAA